MFKHILLPTDGSPLAAKAVKAGIALAKETGAKVTGFCAVEPLPGLYYGDSHIVDRRAIADFERRTRQVAQKHLAAIRKAAVRAGVPCSLVVSREGSPAQSIVDTARKQKCDAIVIGSHGRGRVSSVLLGSVTQKVLAQSKLPVLIYR